MFNWRGLLLALTCLLAGATIGWFVSPGPFRYHYVLERPLPISSEGDSLLLPTGTHLVSDVALIRSADLGWWAYVPVYFPDMWAATDMGISSGEPVHSIDEITLRAPHFPDESPMPEAAQAEE